MAPATTASAADSSTETANAVECDLGARTRTGRGLTDKEVGCVVAPVGRRFLACADNSRKAGLVGGTVVVAYTIGKTGEVIATSIVRDDLDEPLLASCLARAFSRLRFPDADHVTRGTWPIVFNPKEPR